MVRSAAEGCASRTMGPLAQFERSGGASATLALRDALAPRGLLRVRAELLSLQGAKRRSGRREAHSPCIASRKPHGEERSRRLRVSNHGPLAQFERSGGASATLALRDALAPPRLLRVRVELLSLQGAKRSRVHLTESGPPE